MQFGKEKSILPQFLLLLPDTLKTKLMERSGLEGYLQKSFLYDWDNIFFFLIVFIHERKNWQSVFPAFSHAAFHYVEHVLLYLELGSIAELYHKQDAIKFSQGHVTKN